MAKYADCDVDVDQLWNPAEGGKLCNCTPTRLSTTRIERTESTGEGWTPVNSLPKKVDMTVIVIVEPSQTTLSGVVEVAKVPI